MAVGIILKQQQFFLSESHDITTFISRIVIALTFRHAGPDPASSLSLDSCACPWLDPASAGRTAGGITCEPLNSECNPATNCVYF
jgi:hypothetical protein